MRRIDKEVHRRARERPPTPGEIHLGDALLEQHARAVVAALPPPPQNPAAQELWRQQVVLPALNRRLKQLSLSQRVLLARCAAYWTHMELLRRLLEETVVAEEARDTVMEELRDAYLRGHEPHG